MTVAAIVQARVGSTRLPAKVLRPLVGRPMLVHVLERLAQAKRLDRVVVATTLAPADDAIVALCARQKVECYRGSESDVLSRYLVAAKGVDAEVVVRVTSDCPLIDPMTVDSAVEYFQTGGFDYVSAGMAGGFPRGLDTEVCRRGALEKAALLATDAPSREHVTLYLYRHPEVFSVGQLAAPPSLRHPEWRLCVDEEADFELMQKIYERLHRPGQIIPIAGVAALLEQEPELLRLNAHVQQKPA